MTRGAAGEVRGSECSSDDAGGCDCDLWLSTLNMQRKAIEAGRLRMGVAYITGNDRPASGRESEERSEVIATTLDQHATQQSTMLHTRGRCLQDDIRFAYDYDYIGLENQPKPRCQRHSNHLHDCDHIQSHRETARGVETATMTMILCPSLRPCWSRDIDLSHMRRCLLRSDLNHLISVSDGPSLPGRRAAIV